MSGFLTIKRSLEELGKRARDRAAVLDVAAKKGLTRSSPATTADLAAISSDIGELADVLERVLDTVQAERAR